jgi:hypothetical protein
MNCSIHIYLINALYSQSLADEKHGGKESADNRKYQWEDELRVTGSVTEIIEHRNVSFPLKGQLEDGSEFSYDVKKMFLIQVSTSDSPDVYIGASESIVDSFMIQKGKEPVVKLYLKDDEPYANPIPGIYIASKEFPKELIR